MESSLRSPQFGGGHLFYHPPGTMQSAPQQSGSPIAGACWGLNGILQIALAIIASLGLAGVINPVVMGGTLVGLSAASLIIGVVVLLASGQGVGACCTAVMQIAIIVISALAIPGIVSPTVAGWCVVGPVIANLALLCCSGSCLGGFLIANPEIMNGMGND